MKRNAMKRGCALLLLVVLAATLVPMASAAGGSLYITGYTVTDAGGRPVGAITKGSTVNITVSVKDISTAAARAPRVRCRQAGGQSFTGGSVRVRAPSSSDSPLPTGWCSWAGTRAWARALRPRSAVPISRESYQTMETTITEAVVYEAPSSHRGLLPLRRPLRLPWW